MVDLVLLRRDLKHISSLNGLDQEVVHRSSIEMPGLVAKKTCKGRCSVLKPLKVVDDLQPAVGAQLKRGSELLIAAELRGPKKISGGIGNQAAIRILPLGLREAVQNRIGAVFCDFKNNSVLVDTAFQSCAKQIARSIQQKATLGNCAARLPSEPVEDGKAVLAIDFENH